MTEREESGGGSPFVYLLVYVVSVFVAFVLGLGIGVGLRTGGASVVISSQGGATVPLGEARYRGGDESAACQKAVEPPSAVAPPAAAVKAVGGDDLPLGSPAVAIPSPAVSPLVTSPIPHPEPAPTPVSTPAATPTPVSAADIGDVSPIPEPEPTPVDQGVIVIPPAAAEKPAIAPVSIPQGPALEGEGAASTTPVAPIPDLEMSDREVAVVGTSVSPASAEFDTEPPETGESHVAAASAVAADEDVSGKAVDGTRAPAAGEVDAESLSETSSSAEPVPTSSTPVLPSIGKPHGETATEAPAADPAAGASVAVSPSPTVYSLQVGSYREPANARAVVEALRRAGLHPFIYRPAGGTSPWHTVRVGGYPSRAAAHAAAAGLKVRSGRDAVVAPTDADRIPADVR
ncbi:SPOR domain-containing protein [Endothiovibrio diazotrophicus]